jgi:transketolase
MGWKEWVGESGEVIGIDRFGASAPYKELYRQYGLTADRIVEAAQSVLGRLADVGGS